MPEIGIAILRKVIFIIILILTYFVVDKGILHGFDTPKAIKDDPKAISLLLGLLGIAIALS
jgi:hypothetical protein